MNYPVYCIRDACLDAFEPPFVALHDAVAKRMFRNLLDDPSTPYFKNKDDYSLWHVGMFNTHDGIDREDPVRLMSGFGGGKDDGEEV